MSNTSIKPPKAGIFAGVSLGCDDGAERAGHSLLQKKAAQVTHKHDACRQNAYAQEVYGQGVCKTDVWAPTPWGAVPPPPPGHTWEELMCLALGVAQNDPAALACVGGAQHPHTMQRPEGTETERAEGRGVRSLGEVDKSSQSSDATLMSLRAAEEASSKIFAHPKTELAKTSMHTKTGAQADGAAPCTADIAATEPLAEVPVGAVLVAPDGCIVSVARNAPIAMRDPTAHAEVLALRRGAAALGNYRLGGCVLVVTLEPCLMCVGAIIHARLAGVVYGAADMKAGAVESCFAGLDLPFANHRVWHYGGVLGKACERQLKDFFAARRV